MDNFITYKTQDLHSLLIQIYVGIRESALNSSYLHVRSKSNENHNPYHFQHMIENSNNTIKKLKEFYPITDSRIEQFKPFILEEFELKAEKFLNSEIY